MSLYTASGSALATAASTNLVEIRGTASAMLEIREIHVFTEAATALNIAAFRTTAVGTAGTAATVAKHNPAEAAAFATVVTLPTGGTLETQAIRRAFLPATAGSGVIWSFAPGSEPLIPLSGSLILRNNAAAVGPAITWLIVWDE